MKHLKSINENWEEQVKLKNDKIKKLFDILQDVVVSVDTNNKAGESFKNYWDKNADKIILELGLELDDNKLDDNKSKNRLQEVLPTMMNLGYQWSNVAAKAVTDKLSPSEFRDFKNWLKSVQGTIQSAKNKRW